MKDFKLMLILSLLSGVVFSFFFILLAFAIPAKEHREFNSMEPKGKLEKVSQSLREK